MPEKTKIEVYKDTHRTLKANKPRGVTWDRFLLDLNEARPAVNGTVVG